MTLRGDKYETLEEVSARLKGSVVMYDGDPVYVADVGAVGPGDGPDVARVYIVPLPLNKNKFYGKEEANRKLLSSKKFDLRPFKLGFMNYDGRAYYLSRIPARQYTQGLKGNTLRIKTLDGGNPPPFQQLVYEKAFYDCIKGVYTPVKDAFDDLKGKKSVAISRDFAFTVDDDLSLLILKHKDVSCGIKLENERGFRLSKKFSFLKESLEEARIPLG